MKPYLLLLALVLAPGAPARADEKAPDALTTLERKLLGTWTGSGPCDGRLTLKPDGRFVLENLDVSLGWRTTIYGIWTIRGGRLVLMAQRRLNDGMEVPVGENKTEEISATLRDGTWILGGKDRPALRKSAAVERKR